MKTVLVAERLPDTCESALTALGFTVRRLPACPTLPMPVCDHPDLLCARLPSGALLLTREYYRLASSVLDALDVPLCLTDEHLGGVYPSDVLFDALPVGDTLYGKSGAVSAALCAGYSRFVSVRQGYARCSVALLSETAAVTADRSLSEALRRDGLAVLTIRAGHISLPIYDSGFIGGCGGCLANGCYVFFGDLGSHPDGAAIQAFAEEKKIKAVSLSDGPLSDHGGLVVL